MGTSPSSLLNKPTFAVSPVDSSEYIDAAAEETCPAESVPVSEQRTPDAVSGAVSAASREVMDQLKALAKNVTQGNGASPDESDTSSLQSKESKTVSAGEPQAPEPSISVFPRPTGFENNPALNVRPKSRSRVLTLAGFAVAAAIGAGGALAWQTHLRSDDVATAAVPAPTPPAPIIAPYLGRQLEELADDISSMRRDMEELAAKQQQLAATQKQLDQLAAKQQQLAAKQEQVGQSIAKLHTLEQARQKTPAPIQSRAAPAPPRPAAVPPPPVEAAASPPPSPPPPPQTAAHPIPPLPVPQR